MKTKTTRKSNKTSTGRRSMKGKWGKVGAPPKTTSYPRGSFTMATLFGRNKNQCELSIRNKVDSMLESGELVQLKSRRQSGGGVGRPKAVFVLKSNFDASKHEKLDAAPKIRKPRQAAPVVASTEPVAPATPPVETVAISTTEPVATTPVETAPVVNETVTAPAENVTPIPIPTAPEQIAA